MSVFHYAVPESGCATGLAVQPPFALQVGKGPYSPNSVMCHIVNKRAGVVKHFLWDFFAALSGLRSTGSTRGVWLLRFPKVLGEQVNGLAAGMTSGD